MPTKFPPRPPARDVAAEAKLRESRGLLLLERLSRAHERFEVVTWPGADPADAEARFALVPLSKDELQLAYAAALVRFDELKIPTTNAVHMSELHDEINTQVLARAMRVVGDDGRPTAETLFHDADELRKYLSRDATDALTEAFLRVAEPAPEELSAEVQAELWDLVKKKDAPRLSAFSSRTLAAFLTGSVGPRVS